MESADRSDNTIDPTNGAADEAATTRRGMLRLAGAAAAGAAAAAVVGQSSPAQADTNDVMYLGNAGNGTAVAGTAHKTVDQTKYAWLPAQSGMGFLFTAGDLYNNSQSGYPAALGGWSNSTTAPSGVYGYAHDAGYGVVGIGGGVGAIGVLAEGSAANLKFSPFSIPAPSRNDAHTIGEVIADVNGGLWYCVSAGTPGRWRELTAPRYFPIAPGRLYDSRGIAPSGQLERNDTRDLELRNRHDVGTFMSNFTDYVPAGATALTVNITVTSTVGSGFLAVNPVGDTTVHAAAVNWYTSGQTLNCGGNIALGGDREVTVIAGGSAGSKTHFIIDVTGYYL